MRKNTDLEMEKTQTNMDAESALDGVFGSPTSIMPDDVFERMIRDAAKAPFGKDLGYSGAANACALLILNMYTKYPETTKLPESHFCITASSGEFIPLNVNIYDVLKRLHPVDTDEYKYVLSELTGFMWGWAVNAARKILDLEALPNPAVMTFGEK